MPIKKIINSNHPILIWTDEIEEEAKKQLEQLASLPFIYKHIAVMPDVHSGKGSTIGTVFATKNIVIPSTIGVDIGCGMAAIKTPYKLNQIKGIEQKIRNSIERVIPVGFNQHKNEKLGFSSAELLRLMEEEFFEMVPKHLHAAQFKYAAQLGTLGGGNHFIEICKDKEDNIWIMLHSGSRNVGKTIADFFIKKAIEENEKWHIQLPNKDLAYFPIESEIGNNYLSALSWAQDYALENRKLMLKLIIRELAYIIEKREWFNHILSVNCHHNYIARENHFGHNVLITRKGAIRARKEDYGIIPGSMGTKSYIVKGLENEKSFHSASHGAGRKMSRTKAKQTFSTDDLKKQTEGIECRKDEGVIDEIPEAYKDIDKVIENENDLIEIVHELKQIICIKG